MRADVRSRFAEQRTSVVREFIEMARRFREKQKEEERTIQLKRRLLRRAAKYFLLTGDGRVLHCSSTREWRTS